MQRYPYATLEVITTTLMAGAGVPQASAAALAESLVLNERLGHHSHGILRIPTYVGLIRRGRLDPTMTGAVVRETATTAVIDARWGIGQLMARKAMQVAMEKAHQSQIAAVGAYHLNHVGRLGEFTEMAAADGLVAFAFVGGKPDGLQGNVAPFGGARAVWGTNPLAVAIPCGDPPFSLDFATSIIAGGKTAVARSKGIELDGDYLLDKEGNPTRDPWAAVQGGAILPFGEHKGYGLAFVVELLAGALVGAAAPELSVEQMASGLLFLVLDSGAFGPTSAFQVAAQSVIEHVRACPPLPGFDAVQVPGEPEAAKRRLADENGIPVPDSVRSELDQLAQELGVELVW